MKHFLDQIDYPALRAAIRGFFGQEGRHAHAHDRFNQILRAHGGPEPEDITVARWPGHARYGARAGAENRGFLDPQLFATFGLPARLPASYRPGDPVPAGAEVARGDHVPLGHEPLSEPQ